MRTSEHDANKHLKATPKWVERPVSKPGIRLSTVLTGMFILALAAAIGTEVLPWAAIFAGV